MEKLIIQKKQIKEHIKRTISWHGDTYSDLIYLSERLGLSFNFIVNYLVEYMLENYHIVVDNNK